MYKNVEIKKVIKKSAYPHKICEYCGYDVGMNVYIRSHGNKCAYRSAKEGTKKCRVCGKFLALTKFSKTSASTHDGLNQACKECASMKKITCPHCNKDVTIMYKNHRQVIIK